MPLLAVLTFTCVGLEKHALARVGPLLEGMPGIREASAQQYDGDLVELTAVLDDRSQINALTRASMAFYQVLAGFTVTGTTLRISPA